MPKIPDCDCEASRRHRCLLYARNPYLVCSLHPEGVKTDNCIDFRPNPHLKPEEQWCPPEYSYYNGELVRHQSRYTRAEQLQILDTHSFFTGVCPNCGYRFEPNNLPTAHWDCPNPDCDWIDDSV